MGTDGFSVTVAIPSGSDVKAMFAFDLAQMMIHTAQHYLKPGNLKSLNIVWQTATYIHRARQVLADLSVNIQSDYTLFIDSDMRFPPNALIKLLLHGQPMVGCNYSSRGMPARFVAVKKVRGEGGSRGEILGTMPGSTGLEEVEALGFGFVLIRNDVFAALPDPNKEPWFFFDFQERDDGLGNHVGEDVYFCTKVRKAGFKILVDHDLSKRIVHLGDFSYTLEHPFACEKARAEAQKNEA